MCDLCWPSFWFIYLTLFILFVFAWWMAILVSDGGMWYLTMSLCYYSIS